MSLLIPRARSLLAGRLLALLLGLGLSGTLALGEHVLDHIEDVLAVLETDDDLRLFLIGQVHLILLNLICRAHSVTIALSI